MSSVAGVAAASAASAGDPLGVGVAVSAAVASSSAARHTPLHIAATDSSPALLCALLRLGPLVNARSKSGATPLFMACECGQADAVKKLLAAGADMWLATASDETCLYIAALRGHLRVRTATCGVAIVLVIYKHDVTSMVCISMLFMLGPLGES